jgi:hypothetical protein
LDTSSQQRLKGPVKFSNYLNSDYLIGCFIVLIMHNALLMKYWEYYLISTAMEMKKLKALSIQQNMIASSRGIEEAEEVEERLSRAET